jgi:poly(3-hydroxybutyrate) depolymerase
VLTNLSRLINLVLIFCFAQSLRAAPCAQSEPEKRETGIEECLVYRLYRSVKIESHPALVVVLHGDVSSGGPANYHRRIAQNIALDPRASNLVVAALVRPGYEDGDGETSSGSHNGRTDHYTAKNVDEVAAVVKNLSKRFQVSTVVLLGHSGGAATSGVIAGRHPGLASGVVLVACPCNVTTWRSSRSGRPWRLSESPHSWADKVTLSTNVIALTGNADDNTSPQLAEFYINSLKQRGVKARFELVADADHNGVFRSGRVLDAVFELLPAKNP